MKLNLQSLFMVGALALVGCSSTKVKTRVDTGPIKASTFNFFDDKTKESAAFAEGRQQIHAAIQGAITKNLAAKGLRKVDAGGDITVHYLIIVSDGVTTGSINDYFGYPEEAYDLKGEAHEAFTVKDKNRSPYQAGTLVIDMVDSKNFKLLMRNYAWRPILRQVPAETRQARLQEAVDEALQRVRVAR